MASWLPYVLHSESMTRENFNTSRSVQQGLIMQTQMATEIPVANSMMPRTKIIEANPIAVLYDLQGSDSNSDSRVTLPQPFPKQGDCPWHKSLIFSFISSILIANQMMIISPNTADVMKNPMNTEACKIKPWNCYLWNAVFNSVFVISFILLATQYCLF